MTNDFGAPSGSAAPLPPPSSGSVPAPPPPPGSAADIDSLLSQLHEELDLERPAAIDPNAPLTTPVDASRPERAPIVVESTGGLDFDPEISSFGARIGGLAVDVAVLVLFLLPGALIAGLGGSGATVAIGLLVAAVGFVGATVLYARMVAATGRSPGNRVAGTRVVDVRNGALLDGGRAAARYFVRFVISPILLLGYLAAFRDPQRRTFHDLAAGSVVTRPPRQTWSIDDESS